MTTRVKRVFISDIHLNDDRSMTVQPNYNHNYSWISKERIELLAKFLEEEVLKKDDIKELIILGDLFDNWVCPISLVPPTFQQIIDASNNQPVIRKLKEIARHPDIKLYYYPGNHDLIIEQAVMTSNFPGIQMTGGSENNYVGVYKGDGICAEHGNQYILFVAPNPRLDAKNNHILPMGFFLSRFAAEKRAKEGGKPDFWEILNFFLEQMESSRPEFIKNLILSVGKACGLEKASVIQMGRQDNFDDSITLQQVAELYADWLERWNDVKPNGLSAAASISNQLSGFRGTACGQYFWPGKARIVIMGHTHNVLLLGMNRGDVYCTSYDQNDCDYLYANSGTWIDNNKCTYIETEITRKGRHYVRFFEYSAKGKKTRKKERHFSIS